MSAPEQEAVGHSYAGARFAMAPEWLLAYGLTGAEWQVYLAHRLFANARTAETYARRDTVCEVALVSLATYKRAMSRLVEIGAIERVKPETDGRGFRGYIYRLPMDGPAVNPQVTGGGSRGEPAGGSRVSGGSSGEPGGGSRGEPGPGSYGEPPREQTREQTREQNPSRGARAAARAGEQADLDLGVEPQARPSRRKSNSAGTDDGAGAIVAAYIEAYQAAHDRRPVGANIGKVGRDAKRLLVDDAVTTAEVVDAARALGRDGRWNDLVRQVDIERARGDCPAARQGPAAAPGRAPTDFSPEAQAARNYPDLVPEPGTPQRPSSSPALIAEHRRIAERHDLPFDEYVERYNVAQAACRVGDWPTAEAFDEFMRPRRAKDQTREAAP